MFWTDAINDDCTGCKWVNYSDGGGWYMKSRSKKCPVHGSGGTQESGLTVAACEALSYDAGDY